MLYHDDATIGGRGDTIASEMSSIKMPAADVWLSLNKTNCKIMGSYEEFSKAVKKVLPGCVAVANFDCTLLGETGVTAAVATSFPIEESVSRGLEQTSFGRPS